MTVRHGLLALLAEARAHGYQLKADLEGRTGGSWELNIGQIYSTLQRLERDGLVTTSSGDDGRNVHAITDEGRLELARWYASVLVPVPPPRDELALKVALAMTSPEVDVHDVMQRQRTAMVEHLQALTRRKRDLDPRRDLAELIHLDAVLFRTEAEVRWLDLCDARIRAEPAATATSASADHPTSALDQPRSTTRADEDLA